MFKKLLITILLCLILTAANAYAGDIPESLMSGSQQALFIGKLSDQDSETYTIIPLTVMMGNIPQKELKVQKFGKYYGSNDTPKTGDFLVAVLMEDSKIDDLWIFKATSGDYKTLKLMSEKYCMVERYQNYINEGKYFEAQKKITAKETAQKMEAKHGLPVGQEGIQTSLLNLNPPSFILLVLPALLAALAVYALYTFINKKRK